MRNAMNALVAASGIPSRTTRPTTNPAVEVGLGRSGRWSTSQVGSASSGAYGPTGSGPPRPPPVQPSVHADHSVPAEARVPTTSPPVSPDPSAGDDAGPEGPARDTVTARAPVAARTPGWRTTLTNQDRGLRSLAASPIGGRGETSASWTASPHPVSTARRGSNSARRSRRPTSRRCRVRHRAAPPRKGSSDASEDSSAPAERGRLSSSSPSAATTEVTAIHRASSGAIPPGRPGERHAARRAAPGGARRGRDGDAASLRSAPPGPPPPGGRGRGRASRGRGRRRRRRRWSPTRAAPRGGRARRGSPRTARRGRRSRGRTGPGRAARHRSRQEPPAPRGVDGERAQEVRVVGVEVLGADEAGRRGAPPRGDEDAEGGGLGEAPTGSTQARVVGAPSSSWVRGRGERPRAPGCGARRP